MDPKEIERLESAAAQRLPELSRFFDGRSVAELLDDLNFLIQYVRFRQAQEMETTEKLEHAATALGEQWREAAAERDQLRQQNHRLIKEREELRARRDAK